MVEKFIPWIDVESTGLNPYTGSRLLQVACIITDREFNEVEEAPFEVKIHYSPEQVHRMRLETVDIVREMHDRTGLWDAVEQATATTAEADEALLAYIKKYVPTPGVGTLGGNSITLDRNFMEYSLSGTYNHLSHRSLDMTSIVGFLEGVLKPMRYYQKKLVHDALDDIRESIEQARFYRKLLQDMAPPF